MSKIMIPALCALSALFSLASPQDAQAQTTCAAVFTLSSSAATNAATASSAFLGQQIALTATYAPATPAGTVTFFAGGIAIGTATLNSASAQAPTGAASLTVTPATVGSFVYTAQYQQFNTTTSVMAANSLTVNVLSIAPLAMNTGVYQLSVPSLGASSISIAVDRPSGITFASSGLKTGETLSFSSGTVTAYGTSYIATLTTPVYIGALRSPGLRDRSTSLPPLFALLLCPLLLLRKTRLPRMLGALMLCAIVTGFSGCTSNTAATATCGSSVPASNASTHTITITAHSVSDNANVVSAFSLTNYL